MRFEPRRQEWFFGGERRRYDDGDSLVIKRQDLAATTATDLARALRRASAAGAESDQVIIDLAPDDEYSPKETVGGPIAFRLDADGVLLVELTFDGDTYVEDVAEFDTALRPLITPFLRRSRAVLQHLEPDGHRSTAPYFHRAGLAVPTRSRTLLDLYTIADNLADLIGATQGGTLTCDTAIDLVLGGHAQLLTGLPESSWLEVKAQHYDLATPAGTISTAEAVSRFCNAEDGGVVIIGMDTSLRSGVEVIRSVRPVPLDGKTARRYRQACENRLVPFPVGLRVETVPTGPVRAWSSSRCRRNPRS